MSRPTARQPTARQIGQMEIAAFRQHPAERRVPEPERVQAAQRAEVAEQRGVDAIETIAAEDTGHELDRARLSNGIARGDLLDDPLYPAGAPEIGVPMHQAGEIVEQAAGHGPKPACLSNARPASFHVGKVPAFRASTILARARSSAVSSVIQAAIANCRLLCSARSKCAAS